MLRFTVYRLSMAIPVLLVIAGLAFGLSAVAPGDPARILVEASGISPAPPDMVAAKRAELGLDDPLPVRYAEWVGDLLSGDLGRSYRSNEPVLALYADRLMATLTLAGAAALLALCIAVPIGIVAAIRPRSIVNACVTSIAIVGVAVPGFWVAYVLMYVFAVQLQWVPVLGSLSVRGIILPCVVLALPGIAVQSRIVRATVSEVLSQDFVVVARAKGMSEWRLGWTHVLPNALTPALTVIGLEFATLFAGVAFIEYVFAWPGVGKLAIDSVLVRDLPMVVGFAFLAGAFMVVVNLAVDLAVAAIDPRVRAMGHGRG